MCNITSVTNLNGKFFLNCSPYEGEFMNAKNLKIITSDKSVYETKDFVLEKARGCFSGSPSPWIMLNAEVPERFLKAGNQIVLQ